MFDSFKFDTALFNGIAVLEGGDNISLNGYIFDRYSYPIFSWTHNISKAVSDDIKGDLEETFTLEGSIKAQNLTKLLSLKSTFENQYDPSNVSGHCILNLGYGNINVFVKSLTWKPWTGQIKRSLKFALACSIPSPTYNSSTPLAYRGSKTVTVLADTEEIGIKHLKRDGDFRSEECIELLKQADIVVTNPPFSLFREYVAQLIKYDKKFIIIGNLNAITYKDVFKLIKENKLWLV